MSSEAGKVIDLYERHATNWDKDRERCLFEKPWLDRFLSLIPARGSILDLGCGSGEPIARFFIEQGHRVTGADSSASLIDLCKSRFPMQQWIVADMRQLRLNVRFDGVIAWDSVFHLCPEDQRQMLPLFREHSAPNAALLFTSGTSHGEAIGEYRGELLYHGSLDTREYSKLLHKNGFEIVSYVERDVACGLRTIWLAQVR